MEIPMINMNLFFVLRLPLNFISKILGKMNAMKDPQIHPLRSRTAPKDGASMATLTAVAQITTVIKMWKGVLSCSGSSGIVLSLRNLPMPFRPLVLLFPSAISFSRKPSSDPFIDFSETFQSSSSLSPIPKIMTHITRESSRMVKKGSGKLIIMVKASKTRAASISPQSG